MTEITIYLVWIGISLVGLTILLWFFPITLWFQALISGVRISLLQLVLMRWRKVPPGTIVMAMITGTKAGLELDANELEAHFLAKGNVPNVVNVSSSRCFFSRSSFTSCRFFSIFSASVITSPWRNILDFRLHS